MLAVQPPNPEQIEEDIEEILRELGYITPSPTEGGYFPVSLLRVIFIIIALAIVLYFVFFILSRSVFSIRGPQFQRIKEEEEIIKLIEKKDYSAFYKKAVEMAKKREYLEAVRALYMALLVLLDSKQVIAYHPSLTNFEYRQTVAGYPFSDRFTVVTRIFDMVYYGNKNATGTDFARVLDAFTEIEEAVS
ncbi:MAG: DUF4129 domain-containing protein [Theionarchaea archaeon]|nr:MAG: hypothetical protein AYK19_18220 [Theionarchaea archaeon DG-70-1]MBU7026832.1 DUF4129 domain-containing protein [Theionarchaea archaeon]